MERTKGKLEVQNNGDLFAIGTYDDAICKLWELEEETHHKLEFENAKANAEHLVRCWNAFEPDGSHAAMLDVCEKIVEWNKKYPSGRIFSHVEIVKIAAEIDGVAEKAERALAIAQAEVK